MVIPGDDVVHFEVPVAAADSIAGLTGSMVSFEDDGSEGVPVAGESAGAVTPLPRLGLVLSAWPEVRAPGLGAGAGSANLGYLWVTAAE